MSKAIISSWSTCDPGTVITPNRLHIRNPDKLACVQFSLGNGRLGSLGEIEGDGVGGGEGTVYCFLLGSFWLTVTYIGDITRFTNIGFVIQIFKERNKRIFCYKHQCASGWHILKYR